MVHVVALAHGEPGAYGIAFPHDRAKHVSKIAAEAGLG
jgi:hypothetical protein